MPAPIRKKMRRWNDENGSRSRRAPALTVRDMMFPPEMCASIRAGGSLWQAARRRMVLSARPRRPGAVAIAAGREAPLGEKRAGLGYGAGLARTAAIESCAVAVKCNEWAVRKM